MPRGARTDSVTDTAVAVACVVLSLVLLILPEGPREHVAGVVRGNLVRPLAMLQERAVVAGRALSTDDSLRAVHDSLIARSFRLEAVSAENQRLRDLLGLGRALEWGYTPAEALTGRGDGAAHTLLLSAGSVQGVERMSAVVAPDGVVGMVSAVEANTSVAIVWPHPDFRVSATTADGGAFGIVTAHAGEGAEEWLLELHGVPYRAQLRAGTPVISSGLGGVFPRGILIGTVMRELRTGRGWARSYIVRPAVRPSDITSVMVLSPERGAEGLESVWQARTEALTRRVRAGADSIARLRDTSSRAAADDTTAAVTPARPR